jgi:hypothetical protein
MSIAFPLNDGNTNLNICNNGLSELYIVLEVDQSITTLLVIQMSSDILDLVVNLLSC